ncbi:DUF1302 domain-containing protein [Massilia putida]|uniref:DUF1302 domain-containing protein n=1 Tax=Massilia putida TaxID=1141883 RepID=UPI000952A766|nr:DUF1302 family protein [Massilia putida]
MSKQVLVRLARSRVPAAISLVFAGTCGVAHAASFDTGNPKLEIRWDNTIRYNGGWRMEKVNPAFYGSAANDETEGRFKRGDMMLNRVDLLSELDVVWDGNFGGRVSATGWADGAYSSHSERNPALTSAGNYQNDRYNSYAKRYIVGPSGEILDAFVFGRLDLGATTLNLKLGQHNVYWGESSYSVGNSIAYSQGAVDSIKAATSPGAEAKELYLPRRQLSAQMTVNDELSIGAQYAFSWSPFRLVPGGTYFATGDATRSDFAAPGVANGPDLRPGNSGDYGVMLRYSPAVLGGTVGLYYRKFDEKLPWAFTQLAPTRQVRFNFARDTELLGISLARTLGSVSVGSELSVRKNTALNSTTTVVTPTNGVGPSYEAVEGARGDTLHGLVNGSWLLPRTALWQGGALAGEINFSHLMRVTKNPGRFNGEGYACPAGRDRSDGCSTKNAVGTNITFSPSWPQAFAGWDVSMPTSLAYQIYGNGAALGGGNEDAMTWSLGLAATLYSRYDFAIKYVDGKARYKTNPATGLVSTTNGSGAIQSDHGWLSVTFKTTF